MGGRSSKSYELDEEEDVETTRGCCGCFAKGVCSTFIAIALLASAGLSAAAILRSKDNFWVLYDSNGARPAYAIQTGWLTYHTGGDNATPISLQDLNTALGIMGLASAGALGISFLLAVLYMCITLYGKAGRHMRIVALPSAVLLGGILAAFYASAVLSIRPLVLEATQQPLTPWPGLGWCLAMGSAVLWLLTGIFSCCIPRKRVVVYVKQPSPNQTAATLKANKEGVEPLTGKQPGVLSTEGSSADVGMLSKETKPKSWFGLGRGKSPLAKPTATGNYQMKKNEILNRYGEKNV